MRRCGHAGHAPVFLGQHPPDFIRRKFAQADLHQRPHDAATHLVKEPVAFDDKCQFRAGLFDVTAGERRTVDFIS